MKTKRLDFYFPPLQITKSLSVDSSVSGCQVYDLDFGTYIPDYSVAYLAIQPMVYVSDKSGMIESGLANAYLSNVQWSMYREDRGTTPLDRQGNMAQRTGWEVSTDWEICILGDQKGRLLLKNNFADPMLPVTFTFSANYTDRRTGETYPIEMTYLLVCDATTAGIPVLRLDASPATLYNPLRSEDKQTITASLSIGGRECNATKREFVWSVKVNGSWKVIGSDVTHYYLEVSPDGTSVTIDRTLMGDMCDIRCQAKYHPQLPLGEVSLTETSPTETVSVVRRIPKVDYDIVMPDRLNPDIGRFIPGLSVTDSKGELPEDKVKQVYDISWKMGENNRESSLRYQDVGNGLNPVLDTQLMSRSWGAVLAVDMEDRGSLCAATDYDNALLTVNSDNAGDGAFILLI